ncbi:hypothetical protein QQM39_21070 [Streptomyces sp. DT2A-34]|nr:hypothetical protein [Streptomyces sp. DT2A-34]MDO0913247.1 hypothetical protein [Streptomyces sp. DT2A-34]
MAHRPPRRPRSGLPPLWQLPTPVPYGRPRHGVVSAMPVARTHAAPGSTRIAAYPPGPSAPHWTSALRRGHPAHPAQPRRPDDCPARGSDRRRTRPRMDPFRELFIGHNPATDQRLVDLTFPFETKKALSSPA